MAIDTTRSSSKDTTRSCSKASFFIQISTSNETPYLLDFCSMIPDFNYRYGPDACRCFRIACLCSRIDWSGGPFKSRARDSLLLMFYFSLFRGTVFYIN